DPRARIACARHAHSRACHRCRVQLHYRRRARMDGNGRLRSQPARDTGLRMPKLSAVDLELFANRLTGVSEEMGVVLQSASMSPNIKERRDFSCALFDADGQMVAHAAHIPVHLGSTPLAVRAALDRTVLERGDVVILNDPYAG